MTELPLVVVDVQRGGPSTGLPTKTEQADLLQILHGRKGECPLPVIAAASPADCFAATIEAFAIATKYMTPVMLLTDGYIANGSEPWMVPNFDQWPKNEIKPPTECNATACDPAAAGGTETVSGFLPYLRDENLVRPW